MVKEIYASPHVELNQNMIVFNWELIELDYNPYLPEIVIYRDNKKTTVRHGGTTINF